MDQHASRSVFQAIVGMQHDMTMGQHQSELGTEGRRRAKNFNLRPDLAARLESLSASSHYTQTYPIEVALERLFHHLDDGGQLSLFPTLR